MLEIGSIIGGKYKILHEVGKGGMSVVYLALNEKANKQWAVKVVRKDGAANSNIKKQRLAVEIDILKKLRHKYLPSIVDVLDTEDSFIIIMDYIEGNSLEDALKEQGVLPQDDVIEWSKQLCEVLDYLHTEQNIIYRDMKPANIMLRPDGTVTLIDFGTAREYKVENTKDTISLGTIGYAAPEQYNDPNQAQQQTDARTDIYSLGVTMHHLVTGKDPTKPPYDILPIRDINPNLSAGLENIIIKCTQRTPDKRYQSAAELLYDLEHIIERDDSYRKKQIAKLAVFITSAVLAVTLLATSVTSYFLAQSKLGENYEYQLQSAQTVQDYYAAILTDPTRIEAYENLNAMVEADAVLTTEEGQALSKLLVGLNDVNSNGFNTSVRVLEELRTANREAYQQVCYDIGWSFVSHYEGDDESRYSNAAKWFGFIREEDTENGKTAELFCRISEITTRIKQLQGSHVTETQRLREQRQELWTELQNLKTASDSYEEARRLETWIEIDGLIQKYTLDFINVVDKAELIDMLTQIQTDCASSLDNPDVAHLVSELQKSTAATITKVQSAQG